MKTEKQSKELRIKNVNDTNWLVLLHLSGVLPLFFPTYIIWNRKKADISEMTDHYRAVIGNQAFIFLIWVLGLIGFFISGMSKASFGMLILGAVFSIINALRVLNNKPYKYLFHFRSKNINNR